MSSFFVVASQVLALRLPVLILPLTCPTDIAIPSAVGFVLAGYVRQSSGAVLTGLDGLVARQGVLPANSLAYVAGGLGALLVCAIALFASASSSILGVMLPAELPVQSSAPTVAMLAMIGVGCRVMGDLFIKILTGRSLLPSIQTIALLQLLCVPLGYLLVVLYVDAALLPLGIAWVFALSQLLSALALGLATFHATMGISPETAGGVAS